MRQMGYGEATHIFSRLVNNGRVKNVNIGDTGKRFRLTCAETLQDLVKKMPVYVHDERRELG